MERRKRLSFTPEFRAAAVKLVREGSKSLPQIAKDLDLTESALRNWVRETDSGKSKRSAGALTTEEREELVRLRKENRQLQMVLAARGIQCSMSRKGNCWDNAVAESFFSSLKMELVHDADFATHEQARTALFEYIEVFYNRQRRHSTLGYVSPVDFELAALPEKLAS